MSQFFGGGQSISLASPTAVWAKMRILWRNHFTAANVTLGEAIAVGAIASLFDRSETTTCSWTGSSVTITADAGVGNTFAFNYAAISEHTLADGSYTMAVAGSADDISYTAIVAATAITANRTAAFTFSNQTYRYIKVTFAGSGGFTLSGLYVGLSDELDYARADFDPHAENWEGDELENENGYLVQIAEKFRMREIDINFGRTEDDVYFPLRELWNDIGLQNFFLIWEATDHEADVYFVRLNRKRFENPFTMGGRYRDVRLSLRGRVENG